MNRPGVFAKTKLSPSIVSAFSCPSYGSKHPFMSESKEEKTNEDIPSSAKSFQMASLIFPCQTQRAKQYRKNEQSASLCIKKLIKKKPIDLPYFLF